MFFYRHILNKNYLDIQYYIYHKFRLFEVAYAATYQGLFGIMVASSIAIILPLCLVSLTVTALYQAPDLAMALPYLLGSAFGAVPAGLWGRKIPVKWLHRLLGLLIVWGGLRYLW